MTFMSRQSMILSLLAAGGANLSQAQDDPPPPMSAPRESSAGRGDVIEAGDAVALDRVESAAHEAFRVPRKPPVLITERPSLPSPAPKAVWIKGYWGWDDARKEFAWSAGGWSVPPAGKTWLDGAWKQDEEGWYRVPGTWADVREAAAAWRRDGPPADHPAEEVGTAPRPEMFHVAGIYAPEGDQLVWRPGFWAASRPGWEWFPARWVRRADGWSYRAGSWQADGVGGGASPPGESDPVGSAPPATIRHDVARPANDVTDLEPIPDEPRVAPPARPTQAGLTDVAGAQILPAARAAGDRGPVTPRANPGGPPTTPRTSVMVLPDGRRIAVVAPATSNVTDDPRGVAPRNPAPGDPASLRKPAPKRGSPLLRALAPKRRDPGRRSR